VPDHHRQRLENFRIIGRRKGERKIEEQSAFVKDEGVELSQEREDKFPSDINLSEINF
jgi:hypothetical protein